MPAPQDAPDWKALARPPAALLRALYNRVDAYDPRLLLLHGEDLSEDALWAFLADWHEQIGWEEKTR